MKYTKFTNVCCIERTKCDIECEFLLFIKTILTIYWPLTNRKRDKNTALNKKTVISMYKRNGCFSLVWEYFIFFHLFRNAQVVGSSPTISSKKEVWSMRWSNLFLIVNKRIKAHIIYGFLYLFLSLPYNRHF